MGTRYSRSSQSSSVDGSYSLDTVTLARQEREEQGSYSLDTVTLARQEREEQGTWEVEVSYGGEADLHKHLKACAKNPGHQKFIPVDQFNVEHLPSGYHDNDLVDWVRAMSFLTVRVSVTYVSEDRPETVPGKNMPYPSYSDRGKDMIRVGTGWVDNVWRLPGETNKNKTCRCKECVNSTTPKTQFYCIEIRTAAHVVFDELEAAHTTCHLFFDRGGRPEACSGVVTLSGMSYVRTNSELDYIEMFYDTHDLDLVDKLDKMAHYLRTMDRKLYNKYGNPKSSGILHLLFKHLPWYTIETSVDDLLLTIVVSHPHGCSKQVSVGQCRGREERVGGDHEFTYTTATCPGSSGAPVFVLGSKNVYTYWMDSHCGSWDRNNQLNYCSSYLSHNFYKWSERKYRAGTVARDLECILTE